MPGLPLLAFTRRQRLLAVFPLADFFHPLLGMPDFLLCVSPHSDSVPPSEAVGAAPLLSSGKARLYWLFCRLSVLELRRVLIAPFIPLRGPFGPSPLAQLIRPLLTSATRSGRSLAPQSRIPRRRQISRGKLDRPRRATAGFTFSALDGYGTSLPLASSSEHCLPHIQFLFIGSRLCSALLSGPASRRVLFHPCASLSLHVHHVVKRTCTS